MNWIIPAFVASIAWSCTNIFDKIIIDKENRDPILLTVVWGLMNLLILGTIGAVKGSIWSDQRLCTLCFLAGVFYFIGGWIYFNVVSKEEISTAIPYFQTSKLLSVLMGIFILGERFGTKAYIGIGLILVGAFALSFRNIKHHLKFDWIILLALLGSFFFATRNLILKIVAYNNIWATYFWIGIGMGSVGIIMLGLHHPHLKKKAKRGISHMVLNALIANIAFIAYIYALSQGPLTLVTGIMGAQPLFILIGAFFLTKFYPKFIKEHYGHGQLLKKILSIIIIIIGTILIV